MRIECCCREESPTEQLLNSGSMVTGLSASTECEVNEVNSIYMDDCEGFGAPLGICTWIRRMMSKLEEVAGVLKRQFLEVRPIPLLDC